MWVQPPMRDLNICYGCLSSRGAGAHASLWYEARFLTVRCMLAQGQTPTTPGDFTGTVLSPKPPASTPPKSGSPSAGTPASPGAAGKSPAATPAAPAADAPPTGPELPASVQATIPGIPVILDTIASPPTLIFASRETPMIEVYPG